MPSETMPPSGEFPYPALGPAPARMTSLLESHSDRAVESPPIAATNAGRRPHRVGAIADRRAVPAPARTPFWMLTERVPTPM